MYGLGWESSCFCRDCWDITDIPPKVLMACQDSTFSTLPVLFFFGVVTFCHHSHWNPHLVLALGWPICVYMFVQTYRCSRLSIKRLPFTLCSNRDSEWFIKAPPFNTHRPFGSLRNFEIVKPHDIIIHYPCHYELPVSNDQDFSFSIILSANLLTKQDSYPISERAKQVVSLWTVLTWCIPTVLRCPKVADSAAHSGHLSSFVYSIWIFTWFNDIPWLL